MDNYLVDRETLGQFVDPLINKKHPNLTKEEFAAEQEAQMQAADKFITDFLFEKLTPEQKEELKKTMGSATDLDVLEKFYEKTGTPMDTRVTRAMFKYAEEYLGGLDV